MTREQIDQIAWKSIHERSPLKIAVASDPRPLDYQQLEERLKDRDDFELLWSDFLHAFYEHRNASFFAEPSPASLSPGWQALLAGAAEWLSAEFGLPRSGLDRGAALLPRPSLGPDGGHGHRHGGVHGRQARSLARGLSATQRRLPQPQPYYAVELLYG